MIRATFKLAFLLWSATVAVLALLPERPQVLASDKIEHVSAFFFLAITGLIAARAEHAPRILIALAAFAAAIESAQLVPLFHRQASLADLLASLGGILLGSLAYGLGRASLRRLRPATA